MLRDASHRQVIEKFSFIYTLTLADALTGDRSSQGFDDHCQPDNQNDEWLVDSSQGIKQSEARVKLKKPAQSPVANSNSTLVASSTGNTATINTQWYQIEPVTDASNLDFSDIVKFSEPESNFSDLNSDASKHSHYLGKILFALACGYLVFVFCWLFSDHSGQFFAWIDGRQQVRISQSDAEFIDYMERSLSSIDRQVQATEENTDEEVVFVPVHTPETAPKPAPVPIYNYASVPQPVAPPAPPEPIAPIPAPPPLPQPTALPQAKPQTSAQEPVAEKAIAKPTINHTLVGILDLGDKSAALFKIEGTTQRIWLGEEINNSGWILESITSQTAKIGNQGQVRSLSVGETF